MCGMPDSISGLGGTGSVSSGGAGSPGSPGTASASLASFDPATHVAVVHGKDFSFDAPDSITAGWTTFRFVNDGPGLHHLQIIRLDGGKTMADFAAAVQDADKNHAPPPAWIIDAGGPNAPNPTAELMPKPADYWA